MKKRMSTGGKAALITGACLLAVAGVGTGLYFGVSSIRQKVDDQVAKTGTVTIKNLASYDFANQTDADKLVVKENADGYMEFLKAGSIVVNSDISAAVGDLFYSALDCPTTISFQSTNQDFWDGSVRNQVEIVVDANIVEKDTTLQLVATAAGVVKSYALYNLNDIGYKSLAKTTYVFNKLTQDMKTIKGDLTFKKADILKYADAYEESIKPASSSSAAATSFAAA